MVMRAHGFRKRYQSLALVALGLVAAPVSAEPQWVESTENPTTARSTLQITVTRHGGGPRPVEGNVVIAHYIGTLADGTTFDSSRARGVPFAFTLGRNKVIAGWEQAFSVLHVGDSATLLIPPALAYGDRPMGRIPPSSTLRFEVEFLELKVGALADFLEDAIAKDGTAAGLNLFASLTEQGKTELFVSEAQLNDLGYRYLKAGDVESAILVFRLNADTFPGSANVYDSLGDGFVAAGRLKEAISAYRHSLELNPANSNARGILLKLDGKRQ